MSEKNLELARWYSAFYKTTYRLVVQDDGNLGIERDFGGFWASTLWTNKDNVRYHPHPVDEMPVDG